MSKTNKKPNTIAYVYRSGRIGFTTGKSPEGTLPIARGPKARVLAAVSARARLAYDNRTFLVPGIPEANDDEAASAALYKFMDELQPLVLSTTADDFAAVL
ncbi:MAG TPA: hypothetical protein VGG48_14090 [Rhizomicrobium sp.]